MNSEKKAILVRKIKISVNLTPFYANVCHCFPERNMAANHEWKPRILLNKMLKAITNTNGNGLISGDCRSIRNQAYATAPSPTLRKRTCPRSPSSVELKLNSTRPSGLRKKQDA